MLKQAIDSFLGSAPSGKLYLIDNSPTDNLKHLADDPRYTYLTKRMLVLVQRTTSVCAV